ncbi:acetyl-CoA carboxylase biotin carboxylase subunit family protein [Amycolatopsis sp. NPDC051758]|uniref:acetyl-CoA carboxylase biotin carboxylase subunit family protein n=1 Tax=Amycolatopsis sp. NPDC051758 TaxID=3363935 RepID=UPI00378DE99B
MHIVLLGARAEVLAELLDLGHTLTVLHSKGDRRTAEKYANRLANIGYVPDFDIPELAWSVLLHLGETGKVDLVLPCHELAVVTAGFLNNLLGCTATARIDLPTAMAGRDKAHQKSLWVKHGVPTARYATVTSAPRSPAELHEVVAGLSAPFVVKPPSRGGSRDVHVCRHVEELHEVLTSTPALRHAVIEEMQDGREWHLDGAVVDGQVTHLMVSRYLAPLRETKNGSPLRSVAYPVAAHPLLYTTATAFAQRAVSALGGRWGVFHLEVFGEPDEFVAGELAWRPAGVFAPQTAERTIGINPWTAHARLLAGEEPPKPAAAGESVYGFVCLPVKPGAVNGVTRADIEALPGVCDVQMTVQVGQMMGEMLFSTYCVALALIEAGDIASCERRIDEAVRLTHELHDRKSA